MKPTVIPILLAVSACFPDHTLEWKKVEMETKNHLEEYDFKALVNQGNKLLERDARTSAGYWKIDAYYGKLWFQVDENLERLPDDAARGRKYQAFIQSAPAFGCGYVAFARFLKNCAWNYRGNEYAAKITDVRMKKFDKYIDSAYGVMKKAEALCKRDPYYYALMIDILKSKRGDDDEEYQKILKSGTDRFPDYLYIYSAALDYVSPKWGGSEKEIDQLIQFAVRKTQNLQGQGMYAQLMLDYTSPGCNQGVECVKARADWERMKLGFSNIFAAYPDPHNYNWIAEFVCAYGDKVATRKAIEKIGENVIWGKWSGNEYQRCKDWSAK